MNPRTANLGVSLLTIMIATAAAMPALGGPKPAGWWKPTNRVFATPETPETGFLRRFSESPAELRREMGDYAQAVITPIGDGRTGRLHHKVTPDGNAVHLSEYELPQTHLAPDSIRPKVGLGEISGATRTFTTPNGKVELLQHFNVEDIGGRAVRVHKTEQRLTAELNTHISTFHDGTILVAAERKPVGQPKQDLYGELDLRKYGKTVGYSVAPHGDKFKLTVHFSDGDKVTERILILAHDPTVPQKPELGRALNNLRIEQVGNWRVLSADELKTLKYFTASTKVYAKRVDAAAAKTPRGLVVKEGQTIFGGQP